MRDINNEPLSNGFFIKFITLNDWFRQWLQIAKMPKKTVLLHQALVHQQDYFKAIRMNFGWKQSSASEICSFWAPSGSTLNTPPGSFGPVSGFICIIIMDWAPYPPTTVHRVFLGESRVSSWCWAWAAKWFYAAFTSQKESGFWNMWQVNLLEPCNKKFRCTWIFRNSYF